MSHAASNTGSLQKRPLSGGQLGNAGRGGKIFTREDQERFLKKYRKYKNVDRAAKAVGFRGTTVFRQLNVSERFRAQYQKVRAEILDSVDAKLWNFALGQEAPVHNGQITALFGILRAYNPERYRENVKVGVTAEGDLATFLQGMNSALAAAASKASLSSQETTQPALEHKE